STGNGKYLIMRVTPGGSGENDYRAMEAIESSLDGIRAKFPTIEAGITGGLALDRTLARSTAHDITVASMLAIVSNVLLIVIPFRGIVEPAFCLAALLCGAAWSFGFVTLAIGHLNILSAAFTSILAGIGVNFPIHLMARYDEARLNGLASSRAIHLSAVNTGNGVFAAMAVMALAFVMPAFTSFKAIAELGFISAAGLLLCFLSAILVFPSMVTLRESIRPAANLPPRSRARIISLEKLFQNSGRIAAVAAVSAIAALVLARRVTFNQNLLNLQPQNSEAVRLEYKLLKEGDHSHSYAAAIVGNRADADRLAAKFGALPQVAKAETLSAYMPATQPEKIQALNQIAHIIEPITLNPLAAPSDPRALMWELELLKARIDQWRLRRSSAEAERTGRLLARALRLLYFRPYSFAGYERAMAADFDAKFEQLKASSIQMDIANAKLPSIVRESFVGRSSKFLIRIYPREDIWQDAQLARFVAAIKNVDPDVTGTPVESYAITSAMRRGYEHAAILAMAAVLAFVLADLKNPGETLLAMLPLALGGAWLLGAMDLLGWDFNLANLFAVPILIATGVDNGVNMVYRWREERRKPGLILRTAIGKSVTICSLTTIAGFAALIPASSRGISSLGLVLSLGVSFILAATLIVVPAVYQLVRGYFQPAYGNVLSVPDDVFGRPYTAEERDASTYMRK
ncbi:MAG: MMPL family transporter, partial [Deltaproteobacteria bacterium]|nr:MMPL family transporter [Deltaproteobacteria bacterium]